MLEVARIAANPERPALIYVDTSVLAAYLHVAVVAAEGATVVTYDAALAEAWSRVGVTARLIT